MILKLADMLSYLLYESDEELVLIEKEIEVTLSYITLQQAAGKNKANFELRVLGNTKETFVAPLILFAFTEGFYEIFFEQPAAVETALLEVELKDATAVLIIDCVSNSSNSFSEKINAFQLQLQNLYPHQNKTEVKKSDNGFMLLWEIPVHTKNIVKENKTVLHEERMAV